MRKYLPNILEYAAIILVAEVSLIIIQNQWLGINALYVLVVFLCWAKTAWFIYETSHQLAQATQLNMAYHKFLTIVAINMGQIMISFGFDYYVLQHVNNTCFNEINPNFTEGELLFECMYFSALNFSYFGYGDITPANIPAKLVSLTEILLGFMTVIFILSDFITLKESLSKK
jgi:hypothetical protein